MTTISDVMRSLADLYAQTGTTPKKKVTRGARRNKARVIYREMKRPGLVNPRPVDPEAVSPLLRHVNTASRLSSQHE